MRRRVQFGIALQVLGTQVVNFLHTNTWETFYHAQETFYFENSAALLALHVLIVWRYQAFLRDALLARHVTRISRLESPLSLTAEGHAAQTLGEQVSVQVDIGPWSRRLDLVPRSPHPKDGREDVDVRTGTPFGRLLRLGVLHADLSEGQVHDVELCQRLRFGDLVVANEELFTNVVAVRQVFVGENSAAPFLADTDGDSVLEQLEAHPRMHWLLQWNGGRIFDLFGYVALAMGAGTILIWSWPEALKPARSQPRSHLF